MKKINFEFSEKINFKLFKKILFLALAAMLMSLAQSILNYTSAIGMAPIDAFTKAFGNMVGLPFPIMNYIVVFILMGTAIAFSKKETLLITLSAFITGLSLAFFVQILSDDVVRYFPHLIMDSSTTPTDYSFKGIWWGIFYFLIGYFLLTLSIGIWLNIGFGLRPYEVMQMRILDRFEKVNASLLRNLADLIFIVFALTFSLIYVLTHHYNFFEKSSVGVGTIVIMFTSGFVIQLWRKLFTFVSK